MSISVRFLRPPPSPPSSHAGSIPILVLLATHGLLDAIQVVVLDLVGYGRCHLLAEHLEEAVATLLGGLFGVCVCVRR